MAGNPYPNRTVFYGHGIADPTAAPWPSAERITNVAPANLDRFLATLGDRGTLTFDDGYLDNLMTALPILEKHHRPATVFVTCGFIDNTSPPMERVAGAVARAGSSPAVTTALAALGITAVDAEARFTALTGTLKPLSVATRRSHMDRLMAACDTTPVALTRDYLDVDALCELARHPLITIGAHTRTHPDLRYAADNELRHELVDARVCLADWIGQTVDTLAYPYGDTDARVRRAAARAGYQRGYVVEQPNWRSRLPGYGRLDIARIDLSSAVRRMHKHERRARASTKA